MPSGGFESAIARRKRSQVHVLDLAPTETGRPLVFRIGIYKTPLIEGFRRLLI
jgi:hypothetical protein